MTLYPLNRQNAVARGGIGGRSTSCTLTPATRVFERLRLIGKVIKAWHAGDSGVRRGLEASHLSVGRESDDVTSWGRALNSPTAPAPHPWPRSLLEVVWRRESAPDWEMQKLYLNDNPVSTLCFGYREI